MSPCAFCKGTYHDALTKRNPNTALRRFEAIIFSRDMSLRPPCFSNRIHAKEHWLLKNPPMQCDKIRLQTQKPLQSYVKFMPGLLCFILVAREELLQSLTIFCA